MKILIQIKHLYPFIHLSKLRIWWRLSCDFSHYTKLSNLACRIITFHQSITLKLNWKILFFSWHPPCTACFWLTKSLFVFSIWYHLDLTPWVLLPRRPTPTSPSPRPRLRPPCVSRRASSRPWGTGHRSSWVRGSQWNILLQINSFPCCTWLRFRRLAALLDYNIWKDRWRAKSKHWG